MARDNSAFARRPARRIVSPMRTSIAAVLLASAACTESTPTPPPPGPDPSPLARCADPAVALEQRWQVDNLHAPITALTSHRGTVVVGSADGAVKLWNLSPAGATAVRPGYGEPITLTGAAVGALATSPDGAVAAVDVDGGTSAWALDGAELMPRRAVLPAAGALVSLAADGATLLAGTAEFAGDLRVVDLGADTATELLTELWHVEAARATGTRWVLAGEWYGCVAVEVRDTAAAETRVALWDACRGTGGTSAQGRFHALALDAAGTSAVVVGDGLIARFDLADVEAGPVAQTATDLRLDRVVRLDGDDVVVTLGHRGAAAELTWWSLDTLQPLRTAALPALPETTDLVVEPVTGVAVTAAADGTLRGHACAE